MKKIINILLIGVLVLTSFSCDEFLEEEPKGFASSENLLTSELGVLQTLNGAYRAGQGLYNGRWYVMMYGISSDDIFFRKGRADRVEIQNFTFTAENGNLARAWTAYTSGIVRCNQIIESMGNFPDSDFKSQVDAEARFLRAWYYFGQVRTYGEVPLVTSFSNAELFPTKASIPDIYDQIIDDLQIAESILPSRDETEGGRANRGAAKAVLGKVYLTMATTPETADAALFTTAANKLKEVIDNEGYSLISDYKEVFEPQNSNGAEDVWSYQAVAGTDLRNSISADFQPNPNIYGIRGFENFTVFESTRDMIDVGDRRREIMLQGNYTYDEYDANTGALISSGNVGETSDGGSAIHTYKYLDPDGSRLTNNDLGTNTPLIRYADVLLMYSEALNQAGSAPTAEAYTGIDEVRARSGASVLPRGLSKEDFQEAIIDERLMEFIGEGMRWFDLVRWELLEEKVESVKPDVDVVWPRHRFFPIPQTEVDANINLDQNPNYL